MWTPLWDMSLLDSGPEPTTPMAGCTPQMPAWSHRRTLCDLFLGNSEAEQASQNAQAARLKAQPLVPPRRPSTALKWAPGAAEGSRGPAWALRGSACLSGPQAPGLLLLAASTRLDTVTTLSQLRGRFCQSLKTTQKHSPGFYYFIFTYNLFVFSLRPRDLKAILRSLTPKMKSLQAEDCFRHKGWPHFISSSADFLSLYADVITRFMFLLSSESTIKEIIST